MLQVHLNFYNKFNMNNAKQEYCPLSIEIKGKIYCFKIFKLEECTNCIKDDLQRRKISA